MVTKATRDAYNQILADLDGYWELSDEMIETGATTDEAGSKEAQDRATKELKPLYETVYNDLKNLMNIYVQKGDQIESVLAVMEIIAVIIMIAVIILSILSGRRYGNQIADGISKPLQQISERLKTFAEGDLDSEFPEHDAKDEVAEMIETARQMADKLNMIISDSGKLLNEMADGNFAIATEHEEIYTGKFNDLLVGLRNMNRKINESLRQVEETAEQVSLGSGNMAEAAQSLAEGATEQAGAVEELQATIADITANVEHTAENLQKSHADARKYADDADHSREQMHAMVEAMQRISESSMKIENIISELEDIYPTASKKSKEDEAFREAAMEATSQLQAGRRGYRALLAHILDVSVTDLKKNYDNLNVSFELWKGESDAQPYIPDMVQMMKDKGFAYMSEGALVVDVKEDTDTKEIPPCIILKSDGASLYSTTDLATIVMRMQDYNPDAIIYLTDQRQSMHFVQVFRCARKTGLVGPDVELTHIGFGTMNGKDGKPFKTRDGGVMRLEYLLDEINEEMLKKITENQKEKENLDISEEEAKQTAKTVALAAVKYGDLSNQASKDYCFDIERFTSFEGNTGPYILYTIVRIKSILKKYTAKNSLPDAPILGAHSASEKNLMLVLSRFNAMMENAYEEKAPHKICAYIYELANAFNGFYHETKILSEEDFKVQASYIGLLVLTKNILETCIDVLGFSAPERM